MVKIADSAAMREYIATGPRAGSFHSSSAGGSVMDVVVITFVPCAYSATRTPLLVFPVRIVRVLEVPERTAALDRWDDGKVIFRRRRFSGPFESPGIPGIVSSGFATVVRPQQVSQEHQDSGCLEENADGHDEVPFLPAASWFVGVDPSRHAEQSWDMHEVEGQVEAD